MEKDRRDDAKARQHVARKALTGLDYSAHPSSYFGWLRLPEHVRADQAATRLADEGILTSTADAFSTTPHPPHALRLALATPPLSDLPNILDRLRTNVEAIPW